jgi:hypothetical protein
MAVRDDGRGELDVPLRRHQCGRVGDVRPMRAA